RAYPFADLSRELLENVLDMLAGRYPSDEFAELRPRLNWDRVAGTLQARPGARMLAVTSGGTIPDRGLYGVFTPAGSRVGELGEGRVCVLTPFGARVHAPWALATEARLHDRLAVEVQTMWSDDGFVLRLPESDEPPPLDELLPEPDEIEDLVVGQVADSALFAARFRETAARALLLPRRRPGSRTPLWQQRQRAADLLAVASQHGSFPILLETYRECLRDVFDLPALVELLRDIRARRVRVVSVDTVRPSPFASSLAFAYIATFLYEGDAPLA